MAVAGWLVKLEMCAIVGTRWVPEETASWWSHLFFSYCTPLMRLGLSKPLEVEDVWDIPNKHEATVTSQKF